MALWAAGLGAAAQFGKVAVLFDALRGIYAAQSAVELGLMVSVVGIVGMVFGTMAGIAVARVGARRAVILALLLGAGISLWQSAFPSFSVMMLLRVLEGFSHLVIVVVGPTAIAAVTPAARQGLAMSLWSTFFGLTFAVLFAVGPVVLEHGGPAVLFQGHAVWMLGCAAALWFLMPREAALPFAPEGGVLARHLAIYRSARIAAPATGFVCYTITYVALLTLLPGAVSAGWGGVVGVGMPVVSIVVSLTLGVWLLSRFPAVRVVQAGFVAAAGFGGVLWGGWGYGPAEAATALAVAGSLGLVQGASFAAIPQLNARAADRAAAAGAIAQLGNLGTTLGTPLLALILSGAGASGLALFLVGFSMLGLGLHAWQQRRRISG